MFGRRIRLWISLAVPVALSAVPILALNGCGGSVGGAPTGIGGSLLNATLQSSVIQVGLQQNGQVIQPVAGFLMAIARSSVGPNNGRATAFDVVLKGAGSDFKDVTYTYSMVQFTSDGSQVTQHGDGVQVYSISDADLAKLTGGPAGNSNLIHYLVKVKPAPGSTSNIVMRDLNVVDKTTQKQRVDKILGTDITVSLSTISEPDYEKGSSGFCYETGSNCLRNGGSSNVRGSTSLRGTARASGFKAPAASSQFVSVPYAFTYRPAPGTQSYNLRYSAHDSSGNPIPTDAVVHFYSGSTKPFWTVFLQSWVIVNPDKKEITLQPYGANSEDPSLHYSGVVNLTPKVTIHAGSSDPVAATINTNHFPDHWVVAKVRVEELQDGDPGTGDPSSGPSPVSVYETTITNHHPEKTTSQINAPEDFSLLVINRLRKFRFRGTVYLPSTNYNGSVSQPDPNPDVDCSPMRELKTVSPSSPQSYSFFTLPILSDGASYDPGATVISSLAKSVGITTVAQVFAKGTDSSFPVTATVNQSKVQLAPSVPGYPSQNLITFTPPNYIGADYFLWAPENVLPGHLGGHFASSLSGNFTLPDKRGPLANGEFYCVNPIKQDVPITITVNVGGEGTQDQDGRSVALNADASNALFEAGTGNLGDIVVVGDPDAQSGGAPLHQVDSAPPFARSFSLLASEDPDGAQNDIQRSEPASFTGVTSSPNVTIRVLPVIDRGKYFRLRAWAYSDPDGGGHPLAYFFRTTSDLNNPNNPLIYTPDRRVLPESPPFTFPYVLVNALGKGNSTTKGEGLWASSIGYEHPAGSKKPVPKAPDVYVNGAALNQVDLGISTNGAAAQARARGTTTTFARGSLVTFGAKLWSWTMDSNGKVNGFRQDVFPNNVLDFRLRRGSIAGSSDTSALYRIVGTTKQYVASSLQPSLLANLQAPGQLGDSDPSAHPIERGTLRVQADNSGDILYCDVDVIYHDVTMDPNDETNLTPANPVQVDHVTTVQIPIGRTSLSLGIDKSTWFNFADPLTGKVYGYRSVKYILTALNGAQPVQPVLINTDTADGTQTTIDVPEDGGRYLLVAQALDGGGHVLAVYDGSHATPLVLRKGLRPQIDPSKLLLTPVYGDGATPPVISMDGTSLIGSASTPLTRGTSHLLDASLNVSGNPLSVGKFTDFTISALQDSHGNPINPAGHSPSVSYNPSSGWSLSVDAPTYDGSLQFTVTASYPGLSSVVQTFTLPRNEITVQPTYRGLPLPTANPNFRFNTLHLTVKNNFGREVAISDQTSLPLSPIPINESNPDVQNATGFTVSCEAWSDRTGVGPKLAYGTTPFLVPARLHHQTTAASPISIPLNPAVVSGPLSAYLRTSKRDVLLTTPVDGLQATVGVRGVKQVIGLKLKINGVTRFLADVDGKGIFSGRIPTFPTSGKTFATGINGAGPVSDGGFVPSLNPSDGELALVTDAPVSTQDLYFRLFLVFHGLDHDYATPVATMAVPRNLLGFSFANPTINPYVLSKGTLDFAYSTDGHTPVSTTLSNLNAIASGSPAWTGTIAVPGADNLGGGLYGRSRFALTPSSAAAPKLGLWSGAPSTSLLLAYLSGAIVKPNLVQPGITPISLADNIQSMRFVIDNVTYLNGQVARLRRGAHSLKVEFVLNHDPAHWNQGKIVPAPLALLNEPINGVGADPATNVILDLGKSTMRITAKDSHQDIPVDGRFGTTPPSASYTNASLMDHSITLKVIIPADL